MTSCKFNEIIDVKSIVGVVEIFKKEHHMLIGSTQLECPAINSLRANRGANS